MTHSVLHAVGIEVEETHCGKISVRELEEKRVLNTIKLPNVGNGFGEREHFL